MSGTNLIRSALLYAVVVGFFTNGIPKLSAEIKPKVDFADLIRTPASIQHTLERCDGNPGFETALANWLEMAEPPALADRRAIRETSLRLLEDTTNVQLVLGLSDGLLRHALEDVKRDQTIVPELFARALYADIRKAVKDKPYKAKAAPIPAWGLAEDGTVTDERLARFLQDFLNLAEPRVSHVVRPYGQTLVLRRSSREQADRVAAFAPR
jgi:hypothetical protein